MKKLILLILWLLVIGFSKSEAQSLTFNYGGSFSGFGDLQGKFMSIGYQQQLYKSIHIYGSISNSSVSGNKLSYIHSDKLFLGLDYTGNSVMDIKDFFNNGDITNNRLLSIGSEQHYDPPFFIISQKNVDIGLNIRIYKSKKIEYYVEGNLSLAKLELSGTAAQRDVYVNAESWVNDKNVFVGLQIPPRLVVLETPSQDHFLDFGFGYGVGIDYKFFDYFTIGANGHYNEYLNDAQNFVTWGIRLGLKI